MKVVAVRINLMNSLQLYRVTVVTNGYAQSVSGSQSVSQNESFCPVFKPRWKLKIKDIVTSRLSQSLSDKSKKFESDGRKIIREDRERKKRQLNIVAYEIPELCEEAADIQMLVQDYLAKSYNLPSVNVLKPQQLGNHCPKRYNCTRPKVLVLANSDVDSICASKILQHLLHSDCTTYSLVPVYGHTSLEKAFEEHGSNYKYIIFINCGGTMDLVESLQPDDDIQIFVADNHLPTDVNNIYNTGQIKLLLKPKPTDNIPDFDDIFQKSRFDETAILKRRERRLWEDKRDKILDDYTQSTYYGDSAAFLMFELAWKLSKDSNELLWWAIIGVTEQYLLQKVESTQFTLAIGKLQNHVSRLSKHGERANSVAKNCMKIFFEKDLSLALYRHWTLSESVYHTRYTSCKFKIWTLKGQKRFAEFLADLG
ncbi:hypothetical protein QYM36_001717 [Artemia franciscana]|uniref:Uncharacterized protein n=1 Tax=Artemia franciscana TaxID=6661 RepID=A0AA88L9A0_ARTSF|nr:hypothetical protein QYM36_001717 [Artemia franciscana]